MAQEPVETFNHMNDQEIQALIERAIREPGEFVKRIRNSPYLESPHGITIMMEPAVLWQARAVHAALKEAGVIQ